jgi:flagellin
MPQVINSNIATLTAQRNSNRVQNDLSSAIGRLSSGLRINSAKDDAAGLAISERFNTQIRGLTVANRNANDAISLAQTAEGALASTADNLQRIRELAVQAANATNSASDRAALQAEAAARIAEIQRVGAQTDFNGIKLLDGSFSAQAFQVGANSGQTISVASIVDARSASLGSHTLNTSGTIMNTVVTGSATNNGITAGTTLTLTTAQGGTTSAISYAANAGADAIATAINNAASGVGITATASNTTIISALSGPGTVSFTLNGQAVSAVVADQNDLSNLVSAINGVAATTGVTATFTSTSAKNNITLTTTDGRNIGLGAFANSTAGNDSVSFGGTTLTEGGTVAAIKTGTIALTSTKGAIATASASTQVFTAAVSNSSFSAVAAVDLSTVANATSALTVLDSALSQVNSGRADLGAVQNRFQATIANLDTFTENLSASRSRILDADFAKETAALSRAQVLQQAANAMVAQANQMPQQVLALLR